MCIRDSSWFYRVTEPFFLGMENGYRNSLAAFMKVRWMALVIIVSCLAAIYFISANIQEELAPMEDRDQFRISLTGQEEMCIRDSAYVMQLLRGVRHEGTTLANTYLASMGFGPGDPVFRARLASMGPLGVRAKGEGEPIFADPDVVAWARHTFSPRVA